MIPYYFLQFAALIDANEVGIPKATSDQKVLVQNILYPTYFWASAIAVIVIIAAGFFYVTSNGNPQQVTRAKNAILGAVVGLIVVLLAFTITFIVIGGLK